MIMPTFGKDSELKLQKLHPDLQKILIHLIKIYDFKILETYRNEEDQNKAFNEGKSKLKYPQSKHNKIPSLAVDIAP
jgi:peptidoglycan L-alanyl-D-glutamate endopeptidase CwlK